MVPRRIQSWCCRDNRGTFQVTSHSLDVSPATVCWLVVVEMASVESQCSSVDNANCPVTLNDSGDRLATANRVRTVCPGQTSDDPATARARAVGAPGPVPGDVLGLMRALQRAGVRSVLTGELVEVLHGSPLLPITGTVTIVPRAGQGDSITAMITAATGEPTASPGTTIDAPLSFSLETHGTELVLTPTTAGTQGYDDLRRDTTDVELDAHLAIPVASLVDLIRIAEASGDHAHVPALRRTLELTTFPPVARAA